MVGKQIPYRQNRNRASKMVRRFNLKLEKSGEKKTYTQERKINRVVRQKKMSEAVCDKTQELKCAQQNQR